MKVFLRHVLTLGCIASLAGAAAQAQPGGVTRVDTVVGPSLTNNMLGDSDRRLATVYLPPGYDLDKRKRYPVVYLLHGFAADHRAFIRGAYQNLHIRLTMDSLIRAGAIREMIVVTPDARNAYDGSYYMNSPVTGEWETFIARDLVRHMDRRYRTIRRRAARGIAGHSMGGYGALYVGVRNPQTFSAVYSLSACCIGFDSVPDARSVRAWQQALRVSGRAQLKEIGFASMLLVAGAAARSPNTANHPLYVDFPWRLNADTLVLVPSVATKWRRTPLGDLRAHLPALRRLHIAFDAGRNDAFSGIPLRAEELHGDLTRLGVAHEFEIYEGTHGSRIRDRITRNVLPFFSRTLRHASTR